MLFVSFDSFYFPEEKKHCSNSKNGMCDMVADLRLLFVSEPLRFGSVQKGKFASGRLDNNKIKTLLKIILNGILKEHVWLRHGKNNGLHFYLQFSVQTPQIHLFFKRIITGDENGFICNNVERRR